MGITPIARGTTVLFVRPESGDTLDRIITSVNSESDGRIRLKTQSTLMDRAGQHWDLHDIVIDSEGKGSEQYCGADGEIVYESPVAFLAIINPDCPVLDYTQIDMDAVAEYRASCPLHQRPEGCDDEKAWDLQACAECMNDPNSARRSYETKLLDEG